MKKTYLWWKFLCLIAGVNIIAWLSATWMRSDMQDFSYWQPVLSGIYVLVCAFRSFYPRIDLERYCLFDKPLSSVALGRATATIAEICFSMQCALLVYDLGSLLRSSTIITVSYFIVPIIVLAQVFCWRATITLDHFWHGMEELAWVVMIILAGGCFATGYLALDGFYQVLMVIGLLGCIGCAYIMLFIDIPMYFSRKKQHVSSGEGYLNVKDGLQDAMSRRVQTSDWNVWKKEVVWITAYFTFGVWLSIGMVMINLRA